MRFKSAFQILQSSAVVACHRISGYACDLGNDLFDIGDIDDFVTVGFRNHFLCSTCFVQHVDGFVRQFAVRDKAHRQIDSSIDRGIRKGNAVIGFVITFEAFEDSVSLRPESARQYRSSGSGARGRGLFQNADDILYKWSNRCSVTCRAIRQALASWKHPSSRRRLNLRR
jgi:hypothetical protein